MVGEDRPGARRAKATKERREQAASAEPVSNPEHVERDGETLVSS